MASVAAANGITSICATPHVNARFATVGAPVISTAARTLREALVDTGIELTLQLGAEVSLTRLPDLEDEELARLCLGSGTWLLLEAPFTGSFAVIEAGIFRARNRALDVLLAHPERSAAFQREPALLERVARGGVRIQICEGSLAGRFGQSVRELAMQWLAAGLVDNIATDAHDAEARPPTFTAARHAVSDPGLAHWLLSAIPTAMLAGDALPERPARPTRGDTERRWLPGRWTRKRMTPGD